MREHGRERIEKMLITVEKEGKMADVFLAKVFSKSSKQTFEDL